MKPHRISIRLPAPLIAAVLSLSISGPLAAFSGHGEAGDSGPYTGPSGLVYTVETEGGFVGIAVTNLAEAEIRLVFMTGQRYEFVLLDGSVEKYRWSAGRMFTQMISEMVLQPGESKEYTIDLTASGIPRGRYGFSFTLTSKSIGAREDFRGFIDLSL